MVATVGRYVCFYSKPSIGRGHLGPGGNLIECRYDLQYHTTKITIKNTEKVANIFFCHTKSIFDTKTVYCIGTCMFTYTDKTADFIELIEDLRNHVRAEFIIL